MKLWWHKIRHWEYWSSTIIYLPTFFLWLVYALKFRSISFYKFSNPSIKNGGLFGESKNEIYKLLPVGLYPKTVLIEQNSNVNFEKVIKENGFNFPLIAKPDNGHRGVAVQKIFSMEELENYKNLVNKDFLIQELIELPKEIGLFYSRLPNEIHGKITGLTLKVFLEIKGNGKDTVESLLAKNPRYEMQILKLKSKIDLNEILPDGRSKCLVPYGNHNLGTLFLDGNEYISENLTRTFDTFLRNIEGINYGRLDIRYSTLEELERGVNFSIIELNGAKSEPTHIYDPKHSFWYGQKEIFKHQRRFMEIVNQNRG